MTREEYYKIIEDSYIVKDGVINKDLYYKYSGTRAVVLEIKELVDEYLREVIRIPFLDRFEYSEKYNLDEYIERRIDVINLP